MDAIEAIRARRSIRDYLSDPVPRPIIDEILLDAAHAPWTPLSLPDPWLFTVIEGREHLSRYGAQALEFARRNRPQARGYEWTERPGFSVFHNAPVAVVISGRADYPPALEECTRAGQIVALSAHARGLGSCWVGAPNLWLADPATRSELAISEGFRPYAALTLGYPATVPPAPMRLQPRVTWCTGPDGEPGTGTQSSTSGPP